MSLPGIPPPSAQDLTRMSNRISFLYLEHRTIDRDSAALAARDARGVVHIPGAALGVLMLGPGTSITHAARKLVADNGATIIDVAEHAVRYYGHGKPLSSSTKLLMAQAEAVTNERRRLSVARAMFSMRFPDTDPSEYNMRQLRSAEGARVKRCYQQNAARVGLTWEGRDFDPNDFERGTPINQALSAGAACLYGVAHAVIVALGMSPGLGIIHTGYYPAFVHDVADLYKAELSIPVAFDIVASGSDDVPRDVRIAMRDHFASGKLISRCVKELQELFLSSKDIQEAEWVQVQSTALWDDKVGEVPGGVDYSEDNE